MTKKFKALSFIVSFTLIISCFAQSFFASASDNRTGTVINVDSFLNVRANAGTTYNSIGKLSNGDQVVITGEATASNGNLWYQIEYNSGVGYVHSNYIKLNSQYVPNADFEKYLNDQGFPESYKDDIRALHAIYPNWEFTAVHTGLTWVEALTGETVLRRSLVNNASSPDSYKSMQNGAYNWSTGTYESFDSGGWVQASEEIVAHYLDPRNFLDATYIFQFEDLYYNSSYHIKSGVDHILRNTFLANPYKSGLSDSSQFSTYSDAFIKAAAQSGVSSFHLASRVRQEQGTNGNSLGNGTVSGYEGFYNYFNIGAWAHSGRNAVTNGAIYAGVADGEFERPWNTPYKAIYGGALYIKKQYLDRGQNTMYFQKFNVVNKTSGLYQNQYMTSVLAPQSEASIIKSGYNSVSDILSMQHLFNIPVYLDMPASPCPKPSGTGNNNNFLDSLTVNEYSFTPVFNRYTNAYTLPDVSGDVSYVNINATLSSTEAEITGSGVRELAYGNNCLEIKVKATSGLERVYTVSVYRQTLPTIDTPSITLTPNPYFRVSDTVTISWDAAADADYYNFYIRQSSDEKFSLTKTADTSISLTDTPPDRYYIYVEAANEITVSEPSKIETFIVDEIDYIPTKTVIIDDRLYSIYDYNLSYPRVLELSTLMGGNLLENVDIIKELTDSENVDSYWSDTNKTTSDKHGFILEQKSINPADSYDTYDKLYLRFDNQMTWKDAATYCESIGGRLAVITDENIQNTLEELIENGSKSWYWIGGNDEADISDYKWLTGDSFEYTNWENPTVPRNIHSDGRYLMMYKDNGKWTPLRNYYNYGESMKNFGFICEIEIENPHLRHIVEFNLNYENAVVIKPVRVYEGETVTEIVQPKRRGYLFAGWYIDKELTVKWDFANDIMGEDNIILYALWEQTDVIKGDINGDDDISIQDAIYIFKYLAGKLELTTEETYAADINNDSNVTIADAIYIFRYLAGKLSLEELQEIE